MAEVGPVVREQPENVVQGLFTATVLIADKFWLDGLLLAVLIVVYVGETDGVEATLTLAMPQTIDQRVGLRTSKRLMFQSIHHASILVMEKLEYRTISLIDFNQIVHFFLKSIHRCSVLIEISCQNHQVSLTVV